MAALALMASCRFAPVFAPAGAAGLRDPEAGELDLVVIACREGSLSSCLEHLAAVPARLDIMTDREWRRAANCWMRMWMWMSRPVCKD